MEKFYYIVDSEKPADDSIASELLTEEEALEKVEDCPWDDCDDIEHQQDVTSYKDEVEYRLDGIKED
jgi:hypothetical protein